MSEQGETETLEVKKDTERADEIKAMKQAWESAEPGRAVKVLGVYPVTVTSLKKFQRLVSWQGNAIEKI